MMMVRGSGAQTLRPRQKPREEATSRAIEVGCRQAYLPPIGNVKKRIKRAKKRNEMGSKRIIKKMEEGGKKNMTKVRG